MPSLRGRLALVTGGAAGIGRAIVEELAREGCNVVVLDLCAPDDESGGAASAAASAASAASGGGGSAAAAAGSSAGRVEQLRVDVADEAAVAAAVAGLRGRGLNYVVNNAAAFVFGAVDAASDADWARVLAVNVRGTANVLRHTVPLLKETALAAAAAAAASDGADGAGGGDAGPPPSPVPYGFSPPAAVVNVSSISAFMAQREMAPYAATKAALVQLTRSAALDLGPWGVRVNALCPGPIFTAASRSAAADGGKSEAELVRDMERHLILKRFGSPREAARACLFLLSDEASFVTGTALMCDGGWSAL